MDPAYPALMPAAILIPIGSEVTSGATVDTNSAYLSRKLSFLGFEIIQHVAVRDEAAQIIRVLTQSLEQADLILVTGGLGPTFDDITKDVLSKFSGQLSVFNPRQFKSIRAYFRKRKRKLHPAARQQAFFPQNCRIFDNPVGVAAGFGFQLKGKWVIALPGVPSEMESMFNSEVTPFLLQNYPAAAPAQSIAAKIVRIPEIEVLKKLGKNFPPKDEAISCGIYPAAGEVTLRMTFQSVKGKNSRAGVKFWGQYIRKKLGENVISLVGESLDAVVGKSLAGKRQTLSLAESMTGGLIAKRITDIPGASRYLRGGLVVYSDQAKMRLLGVEKTLLNRYSAISAQVAAQMAESVKIRFGTTWGLSVTGNAGPATGGRQPVGTVFIGLAGARKTRVHRFMFHGTRDRIRTLAAQEALALLRESILNG